MSEREKIKTEEFDQKHASNKPTHGNDGPRRPARGRQGRGGSFGMETMRLVRRPVPSRREQIERVASPDASHRAAPPPPPRPLDHRLTAAAPRPRPSAAAAPAVPVSTVVGRAPVLRIPPPPPELPVRDGVGHRKRKMCTTFNSRHPTTISPSAGTSSLDLLAEGAAFG